MSALGAAVCPTAPAASPSVLGAPGEQQGPSSRTDVPVVERMALNIIKTAHRGKEVNKPWFLVTCREVLRSKCGNMGINTFFGKSKYIV